MKLHSPMTINGRAYKAGDSVTPWPIYAFFLVHMGMFGASGFLIAYSGDAPDVGFLYMHGGFACLVYLLFYLAIFGREEVKWMLVNAAIGVYGIWTEIDWLLSKFGKDANDYAWYVHVIPFLYWVLYTFLVWQLVLDFTKARGNPERRNLVKIGYVTIMLALYTTLWLARPPL